MVCGNFRETFLKFANPVCPVVSRERSDNFISFSGRLNFWAVEKLLKRDFDEQTEFRLIHLW